MTVEVALSLMTAARTRHLVICDEDGRRTGQVTLARLTHVSGSPGSTDRTRLRDVHDDAAAEAGPPARHQPREARPPAARLPAFPPPTRTVYGARSPPPAEQRPRSARPSAPPREASCAASSPASRST
ncbi:CBS domain-containing protein [Streptomyces evansiae]|uniref:CBS domain-containing protein n=1 Tax=Streptomyces evansiae TaxID=3075535 RepID=UPI000B009B7D